MQMPLKLPHCQPTGQLCRIVKPQLGTCMANRGTIDKIHLFVCEYKLKRYGDVLGYTCISLKCIQVCYNFFELRFEPYDH